MRFLPPDLRPDWNPTRRPGWKQIGRTSRCRNLCLRSRCSGVTPGRGTCLPLERAEENGRIEGIKKELPFLVDDEWGGKRRGERCEEGPLNNDSWWVVNWAGLALSLMKCTCTACLWFVQGDPVLLRCCQVNYALNEKLNMSTCVKLCVVIFWSLSKADFGAFI